MVKCQWYCAPVCFVYSVCVCVCVCVRVCARAPVWKYMSMNRYGENNDHYSCAIQNIFDRIFLYIMDERMAGRFMCDQTDRRY